MWQRRPTKSDEALSRGLTCLYYIIDTRCRFILYAAVAQLVEFQISNLAVARSYLVTCSICGYTQAVEEVCLENT